MVPFDRDDADREAILRRRAFFVASALGGLTLGAGPQAADEGGGPDANAPCLPEAPPAAADPTELFESGRFAEAVRALERKLACEGGAMTEPARQELEQQIEKARARTATIAIRVAANGGEVSLDGVVIGTSPLADENTIVDPGSHEVSVRFEGGFAQRRRVEVAEREFTRVVLEGPDEGFPHPCLSPMPCLSPPPHSFMNREKTTLGFSVAPALALRTQPRGERAAKDARDSAFYGALVTPMIHADSYGDDKLDLRLGGVAGVCAAGEGALVPLGGWLAAQLNLGRRYSASLGVSSGYLIVPGRPPAAKGAADPESGFFVAPEVSPFGLRFGRVETSLRLAWMISPVVDAGSVSLAPSFLTTSIAISYFGYRQEGEDDEMAAGASTRF